MTADSIFNLCNIIGMIGWIILIVLPFWHSPDKFILGVIIALLAIIYAWLLFTEFNLKDVSKFGSLNGVQELFQNKKLLLAGWVHYVALDLFAGLFIKRNSVRHGISHWLVIPCLILTFMFGPVGLLLYLLIRFIVTKNYFASNF